VRAAGKNLQLVGLPPTGLPPQPGPAYRPYPAVAPTSGALHRLRGGQGATQVGTAVGPCAGGGDAGLIENLQLATARYRHAPSVKIELTLSSDQTHALAPFSRLDY